MSHRWLPIPVLIQNNASPYIAANITLNLMQNNVSLKIEDLLHGLLLQLVLIRTMTPPPL